MRLLTAAVLLFLCVFAFAQQPSRSELEKRRQSILESIKQTEAQLEATKKDQRATMGQLRALQAKLNKRQKLINTVNEEIGQINRNIQKSTDDIASLRKELSALKMRYAQTIRYAYKHRSSYSMLAFLFSAEDFNEATRRMKYLQKYREYRKDQAEEIRLTQTKLYKNIDILNSEKENKDVLLVTEEKQKSAIEEEKAQTDKVVQELKGREKELVATIEKNKRAAKKLDQAVQEIIRREIEIARKKAEEEERKRKEAEALAKKKAADEEARRRSLAVSNDNNTTTTGSNIKVETDDKPVAVNTPKTEVPTSAPVATATKPIPKRTYSFPMTPEATALSNSFASNQGKLPWPVESGYIAVGFGKYKHPVAEKVEMENYGVDIGTNPGAAARAVFEGTVTSVFYIQDREWNIIINHGNYFTLYSHIDKVKVKKGDKVSTKQIIGSIHVNEEGESFINFQVWSGANKVNPELWIAK